MLIPHAVHVWREEDGDFHIEWQAERQGTEVLIEHAGGEALRPQYLHSESRARVSGLAPDVQHTFVLRDQYGTAVLARERRLALQGTPNFRDVGGYSTDKGQTVAWGRLFRSGQLATLSDRDVALLGSLGLDIICDFRREEEQESEPSRLPSDKPPRIVSLPIIPGSNARFFEEADGATSDPRLMFDFMVEINRDFAEEQAPTYARMFREILSEEDARVLVHCAAGKDRTGFAVALLLASLGVPRDVIMHDYMLTSRFYNPQQQVERLKEKYQMDHLDSAAVLPMLEVHADYLQRAFLAIDERFQSVDHYLEEALGIGSSERAELKRRYLEPES